MYFWIQSFGLNPVIKHSTVELTAPYFFGDFTILAEDLSTYPSSADEIRVDGLFIELFSRRFEIR